MYLFTVQYTDLKIFKEKYNEEILQFCKKNNIKDTNEEDIMSASLLYFKESFEEFIMYVDDLFDHSVEYIYYLLLLKDDTKDNEFKTNLKQFINIFQEYKIVFASITFFSLPKDIEEEYFSRNFRNFYAMSVVEDFDFQDIKVNEFIKQVSVVKSEFDKVQEAKKKLTWIKLPEKEYTQFVVHYIKELNELNSTLFPETEIKIGDINYNEESTERKIAVDQYIKSKTLNFEKKWRIADKQYHNLIVYYLIHDKILSSDINLDDEVFISDNGVKQTIITAFLKYFKESLDNYFKLSVYFGIDEITDENNKKLFYTRMLRTMLSIYNAYIGDIKAKINVRGFVELMINRAEAILESNKNKNITVIPLSRLKNERKKEITVENYVAEYNKITDMPEKADWKSILKHLIINRLRVNEKMKNIEKE
ncbi:uncharacterized protein LOC126549575 [Aphis gossypii]|uniref:uncharacterized protein LOC126549575 n=1 Tax=Aphis gossypii TaxID=80765 RepID=UPI002159451C|nr:uncharacterized protein LOC126549575 [Aphis gossypii]